MIKRFIYHFGYSELAVYLDGMVSHSFRLRRGESKLMVSIDVYFPIIRILLPTRFDYRSELDESTIDSLLFWAIGIPWLCSSTSWKGELLSCPCFGV